MWLVAEDETDIRNLMQMLFTTWGHQPLAFENGQKVWNWLDAVDAGSHTEPLPELALLDIRMPGKRGDELARRMRTTPALSQMPVVLMTAYALSEEQEAEMLAHGADLIIHKPLPDFDRLRAVLQDVVYSRRK
ncbi:MAG: response regulator [Aggregatilineales bacterium]